MDHRREPQDLLSRLHHQRVTDSANDHTENRIIPRHQTKAPAFATSERGEDKVRHQPVHRTAVRPARL